MTHILDRSFKLPRGASFASEVRSDRAPLAEANAQDARAAVANPPPLVGYQIAKGVTAEQLRTRRLLAIAWWQAVADAHAKRGWWHD